jgi:mRNA-degrading endonuclease YafQ of YafQ-DinJ toxin-antitoxin module
MSLVYKLTPSSSFKRDMKQMDKQNKDLSEIIAVIQTLAEGKT